MKTHFADDGTRIAELERDAARLNAMERIGATIYRRHEDTLQSVCGSGDSRPTEQGISQPSGTAPAEQTSSVPHHFRPSTLCESLYVLKARLSDHLSPAEQRDLDEAIEAISNSDLLRGIALGIEAAAKRADGRHRYEVARDIRFLNPADIAAKNPTEQRLGAEEAKRRVKEKHQKAYCTRYTDEFVVFAGLDKPALGSGPTEEAAWIDAAGRV